MKRIIIMIVGMLVILSSCRYTRDAQDTLFEETKASTLLKKYEWFKDAAAALDAKIADLAVYESRIKTFKEDYAGTNRADWPRDAREQLGQIEAEYAGIKMSYNTLAGEYNSAMAKINYRFCNVGDLPKGATNPLPREYKPYIQQ